MCVQVHQLIGYCPQFDAVLEDLTGHETLTMFCLLRGIPRENIQDVINYLSGELLFKKHINKKIKAYRYSYTITMYFPWLQESTLYNVFLLWVSESLFISLVMPVLWLSRVWLAVCCGYWGSMVMTKLDITLVSMCFGTT